MVIRREAVLGAEERYWAQRNGTPVAWSSRSGKRTVPAYDSLDLASACVTPESASGGASAVRARQPARRLSPGIRSGTRREAQWTVGP